MDYLEPAKEGDWIEAHVDVLRIGRRLAFVEGLLLVGDRKVMRANGTFAVVEPRK
jgi:acyl-coenzyme A thioesterase PaaI-like protein